MTGRRGRVVRSAVQHEPCYEPREPDSNTTDGLNVQEVRDKTGHLATISHYITYIFSLQRFPLTRVINVKFLLQPHQKYYITQYGEPGFS